MASVVLEEPVQRRTGSRSGGSMLARRVLVAPMMEGQ
jgi:hypothetical protein